MHSITSLPKHLICAHYPIQVLPTLVDRHSSVNVIHHAIVNTDVLRIVIASAFALLPVTLIYFLSTLQNAAATYSIATLFCFLAKRQTGKRAD